MSKETIELSINGLWLAWFIITEIRVNRLQRQLLIAKEAAQDAQLQMHVKGLSEDDLSTLLNEHIGTRIKPGP